MSIEALNREHLDILLTQKNYAVQDVHNELGKKTFEPSVVCALAQKATLKELQYADALVYYGKFKEAEINITSALALNNLAEKWRKIAAYSKQDFLAVIEEVLVAEKSFNITSRTKMLTRLRKQAVALTVALNCKALRSLYKSARKDDFKTTLNIFNKMGWQSKRIDGEAMELLTADDGVLGDWLNWRASHGKHKS